MKKLLFICLFFPVLLQAQEIGRFPFPKAVVSTGGGEPTNLISNGTFDSATGWTMYETVTVGSGVINIPRAGVWFYQAEADMVGGEGLELSTDYVLEFDLAVDESDVLDFAINDASNSETLVSRTTYSSGHITLNFTTPSSWAYPEFDHGIRWAIYYSMSATIDNVELYLDE